MCSTSAGWITTGDLGWVGSDGNLRLVGRVAEMYIRGGYNVYPAEVEAVLGDHPGVGEVAVVGVPDPVLGEIGAAVIVAVPGSPVPRALRAAFSVPRYVWPTTRRLIGSWWSINCH